MNDSGSPGGTRHQSRAGSGRIFTEGEKKALLVGHIFQDANLDGVDFSGADLRAARFENTSLRDCDFSVTHLLGTSFLGCDLRGARFIGAKLEHNRFDKSCFSGATGLSASQREYIEEHGGSFLRGDGSLRANRRNRPREARKTRVGNPAHILVFCEDPVIGRSLRAHLASEGFNVTGAKTPLEAAWCLADGQVNLFLIHFPDARRVASAILMEVRRAHPVMPIVGLTPTISNELGHLLARIRISKMLPASTSWTELTHSIHEALGSLEPETGGPA